ncbi:MAG: hypothetical protein KDC45_02500 [Bacteroidetes bacterium]|nr:hypothetical protein [Bacteroidota bacterium]
MNRPVQKTVLIKLLLILALALGALNLVVAHVNLSNNAYSSPDDSFSYRRLTVGVEPEELSDYEEFNFLLDSLMTKEFDIQPGWIKNDRIQLENLMYLRKIIQTPFQFPYTLLNIDITAMAQSHDWNVLNVSELLTRQKGQVNVTIDIGRKGVIYQRVDFIANPRLRPAGKEVFFILNGLGATYDDHVKAYLELPETFAIHVPKGEAQGAVIKLEAEEAGKSVITHLPWSRNVFELSDKTDENDLIYEFFETLNNLPNRAFVVLQDRPLTYKLIKNQFPRATKRGYILRRFTQRW